MEDVLKIFIAYFCGSLLFIVIAFLINRERLIKKYNLDNKIEPIPDEDEVKPTIKTTRILLVANLIVILILSILWFLPKKKEPVKISFTPNEIIYLSKLNHKYIIEECISKGFYESLERPKKNKLYKKRVLLPTDDITYEMISFNLDSLGKLEYQFSGKTLYDQFRDSIKDVSKVDYPFPLYQKYKSKYSQVVSNGTVLTNYEYDTVKNVYTIGVLSMKKYEKNIQRLASEYKNEKAEEEQKKKEMNRQYGYIKYEETYLYETAHYGYRRKWFFDKGTKVKCLDTSGKYIFVMYHQVKGKQVAGWIPKYNVSPVYE